ncbi:MAG: NAD(P)-dependent alcohol dehydrogenase [Phototrophicaceae bacterium]
MQAIVFTEYGSPDVLQLKTVAQPVPKANEVLVKVRAAAANPLDWHIMRGAPIIARIEFGLQRPKKTNRLGADVAGDVVAIGADVTQFKVGDAVFGSTELTGLGAFAEYAIVSETTLEHKPDNISYSESAAIPEVGFTALQGLRDAGNIQAGQSVLINGASGGVGSCAVQLAKYFGTTVTGVCSTRNVDLVRSLGADHVIDYTKADFTQLGQQYDLIYDAVGNLSTADLSRTLTADGVAAIAGFTTMSGLFNIIVVGGLTSAFSSKSIGMMNTAKPNKSDLTFLKTLLATGQLQAVIDRSYPLAETSEAIRYLETGRARGKVVITVG